LWWASSLFLVWSLEVADTFERVAPTFYFYFWGLFFKDLAIVD